MCFLLAGTMLVISSFVIGITLGRNRHGDIYETGKLDPKREPKPPDKTFK
ncbi:Uncharacterised protein [Macrococcoides caseolyticum]|nr:Uncharacterised protein [Macrococcus caseolyticus]